MKIELDYIQNLERDHKGGCPTCYQKIKIYEHAPNSKHVEILRKMADRVKQTGEQEVNFHDIKGEFQEHSQRTKLRQHGLIAKVKKDGVHVRNTWLITRKGWKFLAGGLIPKTVIVYNNTVLGHGEDMISVYDCEKNHTPSDLMYDMADLSPAESRQYMQVREGIKLKKYRAKFLGYTGNILAEEIIAVDRLQFGKPVKVKIPRLPDWEQEYKDMAAFAKNWEIVEEVSDDD